LSLIIDFKILEFSVGDVHSDRPSRILGIGNTEKRRSRKALVIVCENANHHEGPSGILLDIDKSEMTQAKHIQTTKSLEISEALKILITYP
jgi:hypothetical protein